MSVQAAVCPDCGKPPLVLEGGDMLWCTTCNRDVAMLASAERPETAAAASPNGSQRPRAPYTTTVATLGQPAEHYPMEPIEWLWPGRLAVGMLSDLDGDPELGKSTLVAYMAAKISTGSAWSDGALCPAGTAILIGAEDTPEQVLVPRLRAAGADVSRVQLVSTVPTDDGGTRLLSLPEDVALLESTIRTLGATLVAFDPITAFVSANVNANSDNEVRRALTPLVDMLRDTGCCGLMLRHLAKDDRRSNALYRGLGSIAFAGLARTVMAVARSKDEDADNEFTFMVIKSNIARKPKARRYRLEEADLGNGIITSRVVWGNESDDVPENLMTAQGFRESKRETAEGVLTELLNGRAWESTAVVHEVCKRARCGRGTVFKAKDAVGVKARKLGFSDGWEWYLPHPQESTP